MKNLLYSILLLAGLLIIHTNLRASSKLNNLSEKLMDVTPPEFTDCPAGLVTLCTYITATQQPLTFLTTWPIPSATDNSGQVTVVQTAGPISGMTYLVPGVVYSVTYKATDPSGNSVNCTFSITLDEEPPMFTNCPGNLTLCGPIALWTTPSGTDNCSNVTVVQIAGPVNGVNALTPGVIYMVAYKVTDVMGNATTCSFMVMLESEPPVFSNCPGNVTVCGPTDPWPIPTATDNCGQVSFVQVAGPVSGVNALMPGVVYTVGYKATDLSGNDVTCYFTVSIDNTLPIANCSNQTLTFNGQNSVDLNVNTLVAASDDCGIQSITLFPTAITCSQLSQNVPVIATVTDINGNAATCTSSITVAGLPCGWIQNPNGVNCSNGSSIAYNSVTGVWTATSTNCFYGSGFTSDQMAFGQRMLCGDGSITAQVASISGTALGWAGLTMRESSAAGAKKAQLMTNLSNLSRREFRITTDGTALMQQIPSQDRYWLRLVRAGNQFSMYVSPNGLTWYFAGAQNIPMNTCIQMGMVVTNYQQTSIVAATFANVSFSGSMIPLLVDKEGVASYQQRAASFDAYPNPTSGELNVDLRQYVGKEVRLEVYSLTGQLLHFIEINEVQMTVERIDLTAFPTGMYLLKVKSHELPDATRRVVITLY